MSEYSKLIDEWMEDNSGFEHPQDCTVEERIAASSMRHALGELVTQVTAPLHERIRELEQKLSEWDTGRCIHRHHKVDMHNMQNDINALVGERNVLREERDSLLKDKERMDWLENFHSNTHTTVGQVQKFYRDRSRHGFRKAIDSAISQSQTKETK